MSIGFGSHFSTRGSIALALTCRFRATRGLAPTGVSALPLLTRTGRMKSGGASQESLTVWRNRRNTASGD